MNIESNNQQDTELEQTELAENIEVVSPGQMLRDARITKGISQKEVSNRIHLKVSVINDIEHDIFDPEIAQTFVRGYIRCYARFLGIDVADVLSAYDCQNAACEQQAELQSFSRRTKKEASDNRLMIVSYGIIGFMLLIFLIWGFQRSDVTVVVPENQPAEISTTTPAQAPESTPVVPTVEPGVDEPSVPVVTETDSPAVVKHAAAPSEVQPQAKPAAPVERDNIVADTVFTMNFSGDCWVRISDATDKTIAIGVKKAGRNLALRGQPPFRVKLGAPEQVKITYEGKEIDLSSFREGRVAKFELPFNASL